MAALIDNLAAFMLAVVAAKSVGEHQYALQIVLFCSTLLGYFILFEALISRTPGKVLMGLVILQKDGGRVTLKSVLIRTLFRLVEVNPALFGAIPAAVSIVSSRDHQRFGDKAAGTIVALRKAIK